MPKLRILHLLDSLGPGGAQLAVENLVRHGDHERFEYRVVSLHGRGVYAERLRELGVEVISLGDKRANPMMPYRLLKFIRNWRPDIVHSHLVVSHFLAELVWPFVPRGTRLVQILQNVVAQSTDYPYQNALERLIYRRSHAIVAVSRAVARSFRRVHPNRAVRVVYNGVTDGLLAGRDEAARRRIRADAGLREDQPLFLSAARLIGQKNIAYGLEVFEAYRRRVPDAHYWIAGSGPDEPLLRARAQELGLQESVSFLGYRNDVPDLLSAADLYLMPSRFEGLPLVLIEALGSGAIPVVTPFAAAAEVVRDGWNGVTIPFAKPEVAAELLLPLGDRSARAVMAARGLKVARRRFAASAMAAAIHQIYSSVLMER
jgi:glycosyltransferase involved in cell wall biosynthesis